MQFPMASGADDLTVFLCDGATCAGRTAVAELRAHLEKTVSAEGWHGRVLVNRETCFGHCKDGPNLLICRASDAPHGPPPPGTAGAQLHHGVTPEGAAKAVRARVQQEAQKDDAEDGE